MPRAPWPRRTRLPLAPPLAMPPASRIPRTLAVALALLLSGASATLAQDDTSATVAKIEELGGTVRPIAQDSDEREVAFHLSGTELTDEGLAVVAQVPNLVWLNLAGTQITDAGLAHLASVTSLRRLHLEKTGIGDDGLAHLSGLENLEYLNLYGTKVTDAGLEHLASLAKLQKLFLWQTEVTPEGARKLQQALPELEINLGADATPGPPMENLAQGRFVRVRLEGDDRILSLAEVELLETGTGTALQTSGKARQSSTYEEAAAERAIDGNADGAYGNNSVTHTQAQTNPWWLVDLGETKDIGRITLHNRSDCCGERLQGAIVEVFDEGLNVVWTGKVEEASDGSTASFPAE